MILFCSVSHVELALYVAAEYAVRSVALRSTQRLSVTYVLGNVYTTSCSSISVRVSEFRSV